MREPQRLERTYHGHVIVSIQAMKPHPGGDGWNHEVFDKSDTSVGIFDSLGSAIQAAKRAKYPGKYPDQIKFDLQKEEGDFRPVITGTEESNEPPETEETE